jgi:hypothetical protein
MSPRVVATLLIVLAAAGCTTPHAPAAPWYLGGSWTPGYTQADLDAVCKIGAPKGDCAIMESEPPQFGFRFATNATCQDARSRIAAVPHTRVGDCVQPSV